MAIFINKNFELIKETTFESMKSQVVTPKKPLKINPNNYVRCGIFGNYLTSLQRNFIIITACTVVGIVPLVFFIPLFRRFSNKNEKLLAGSEIKKNRIVITNLSKENQISGHNSSQPQQTLDEPITNENQKPVFKSNDALTVELKEKEDSKTEDGNQQKDKNHLQDIMYKALMQKFRGVKQNEQEEREEEGESHEWT